MEVQTFWYLNPWFLSFLGCLSYNLVLWNNAKDEDDILDKGFNFALYWSKNYDNVLVTLVLSFVWVIAAPLVIDSEPTIDWSDLMYIASPIFIQKVKAYTKKK
jgi:hypothetical protein